MKNRSLYVIFAICCLIAIFNGCSVDSQKKATENQSTAQQHLTASNEVSSEKQKDTTSEAVKAVNTYEEILWNDKWEFADCSKIHSDSVTKYYSGNNRKNITVCVNAGHGTKGGSSVYTYCHPDKTPKVTGGSTKSGAVKATSINEGTTLLSGVSEADANLKFAMILKEELLNSGYDVLMIREKSDKQLDNIARTVFANNNADCHISIHYDSTTNDKGMFFIGIPDIESYRNMYPVKKIWQKSEALGYSIIDSSKEQGIKIYSDGNLPLDLTQTSYSTIPSIDLEIGDRASDIDSNTNHTKAKGIVNGISDYFENN